jgi:chaperone required for assembly of F1-ATPase
LSRPRITRRARDFGLCVTRRPSRRIVLAALSVTGAQMLRVEWSEPRTLKSPENVPAARAFANSLIEFRRKPSVFRYSQRQ